MRKLISALAIAFMAGLASSVILAAGNEAATVEKPSISATQKVMLTTVVKAVDLETRTVTLKGPDGNLKIIKAEKTPNLEQVQIGDQVNVEYAQHMSIEVFANDGTEPGQGMMSASAVNTPDQAPGGMEMVTTVTTATVEEINIESNTFKLKMPGGEVQEFTARDPENLKKAEVGDLVVTTLTEAVAIYLVEVPAE
jgi:Cu/Ag efflux protein CusF